MSTQTMRQHRLWWQSSYDRGLDILLDMWPTIKEKYPDAELWITYGWDLFDKGFANNPERMNWKNKIEAKMKMPGITHFGRIGKKELAEKRKQCGIWAYCTYFAEISCIGALESQHDGLVPVTMNDFALKETVGAGFKIDGDIYDYEAKKEYLDTLLKVMGDEKLWEKESRKAQEFAKGYEWDRIAKEWSKDFE